MLYTPRFCCQCGEKIDREKWGVFSSRRFCENCEIDFPLQKWIPALWLGAGTIVFLFGFGGYLKNSENARRTTLPTVENARERNTEDSKTNVTSALNSVEQKTTNSNAEKSEQTPKSATLAELNRKSPEVSANRHNQTAEESTYCGAQTKKGLPCTRRVRGGGRCWQHRGQSAAPIDGKTVAGQ